MLRETKAVLIAGVFLLSKCIDAKRNDAGISSQCCHKKKNAGAGSVRKDAGKQLSAEAVSTAVAPPEAQEKDVLTRNSPVQARAEQMSDEDKLSLRQKQEEEFKRAVAEHERSRRTFR